MTHKKADPQLRTTAKHAYWRGHTLTETAELVGASVQTVSSWRTRYGWDETPMMERIKSCIDARLSQLVDKDGKSNADYKEIDALMAQLERLARIDKYQASGKEGDLNPKRKGNHIDKRPPVNAISSDQVAALKAALDERMFGYQRRWYDNRHHRTRMLLKSRQIGATYYFAFEAFLDAAETGDNQIFLSASRAQSEIFRSYIIEFARDVINVELKGNPITLANGATLYFLSTSSRTAQGYHGHVYMDEIFWVPKFKEFRKVASGMAMHKKWRLTYFSTPSSKGHDAYAVWDGSDRKKEIDVSHDALKHGKLCGDGIWRHIVTIRDALAEGCDLFDLEQLKEEYSQEAFDNLLMCEFVDNAEGVFAYDELIACGVDSLVRWRDYHRSGERPLGNKTVYVGYDPSRTRDNASVVVVAPPVAKGGIYRVLEKHEWRNLDYSKQADGIRQICQRYNVAFIGIDTTGPGIGVYDIVKNFFPAVEAINYSPAVKSRLVMRVKELTRSQRINWDASWLDLMRAFLAIRKNTTPGGHAITFEAMRNSQIGHADIGWAVMHALEAEPISQIIGDTEGSGRIVFC